LFTVPPLLLDRLAIIQLNPVFVWGVGAQRVREQKKSPDTIAEALPGELMESQSSRTDPARSTAIAMRTTQVR